MPLHAKLIKQEAQHIGLFGDAVVQRRADAVAGMHVGPEQDRLAGDARRL